MWPYKIFDTFAQPNVTVLSMSNLSMYSITNFLCIKLGLCNINRVLDNLPFFVDNILLSPRNISVGSLKVLHQGSLNLPDMVFITV